MLRKIIDCLQSKGFMFLCLVVLCAGVGAGVTEWFFNHTIISIYIIDSLFVIYFLVLKLLKHFDPYYKGMSIMHDQETEYGKIKVFYERVLPERRKAIPKTIYKYVSLCDEREENEKRFATLENNRLWFSSVDNLNDPFEGYNCCYLKDFPFDTGLGNGIDERVLNWQKFMEKFRHNFYICSFSKDKNIMPLWAHYTNNYQGYCVEYEVVNSENLSEVQYWTSKFDVSPNLERLQKEYLEGKIDQGQIDYVLLALHWYLCSIKSRDWDYEREVRVVSYIPNGSCVGKNEECEDVGLKIKKIIIGCKCSEENKKRLELIAQKEGVSTEMVEFDYYGEFATLKDAQYNSISNMDYMISCRLYKAKVDFG